MTNNVPNLDCMHEMDLLEFSRHHIHGVGFKALFPGREVGAIGLPSPVSATVDLAHYAQLKATAMQCRLRGEIPRALTYEGLCEKLYESLPEWARW